MKDANATMCPENNSPESNSNPDTDSVTDVTYHLELGMVGESEPESSDLKCSKEDKVTRWNWTIIPVLSYEKGLDMALSKRLMLCTSCGTLRLTN